MIKSGEGPDLFPIPVGLTLNTAVEEGWFQPINDYVTDEFRNKFDPDAFAEGVTDIGMTGIQLQSRCQSFSVYSSIIRIF